MGLPLALLALAAAAGCASGASIDDLPAAQQIVLEEPRFVDGADLPFEVVVDEDEVEEPALLRDVGEPQEAPEDFIPRTACRRSDTARALSRCMTDNFRALLPKIINGGKLMLPSLDPYLVPELSVLFKAGPVEFEAYLRNMSVINMKTVKIRDVRSELKPDSMKMDVDLTFPKMMFKGRFVMKRGKISSLSFTGNGPFEVTFTNIVATWRMRGEKKPGSQYMRMNYVNPVYTVGGMKSWGKDLVHGNPALTNLILVFANSLWSDVVEFGKGYVQKPMSDHIRNLTNNVFDSIPYDTLFPLD